jgi:hypothetical protein
LLGNYTTSGWTLSSDGNGGTIVVDPPLAASLSGGGDPSSIVQRLALLNQYMASTLTDQSFLGTGAPMSSDPASSHDPTLTKSPAQAPQHV